MSPEIEALRLAAVLHVVHDYTNLISAGTEIYRAPKPPLNSHVQYSFLVNCRKFGLFFGDKPLKHPDEIGACHFLQKRLHFELKNWTKWEKHMNVHLFHLSYGRVENTRPWTGYDNLNRDIMEDSRTAWKSFRTQLEEPFKAKFTLEVFNRQQPDEAGRPSEFADLDIG